MSDRRSAVIAPVVLAALTALAGAVFAEIYSGRALVLLLIGAAVLSVGLTALMRMVRFASALIVLNSIMVLALYLLGAVAMTRDPESGGLFSTYLDALVNSGARILTGTIPVQPAPDTVVLPIIVVWMAGLASAQLALRQGRLALGYIPSTVVYLMALVFVGPNADVSAWRPLVFLAVAAAGLAACRRDQISAALREVSTKQRIAHRARIMAIGSFGLVALVAATVAIGPAVADLSDRRPVDPREYVAPPQQRGPATNPLSRLSGWARNPNDPLLRVEMSAPARIRWVALTDFDGVSWTASGEYRSAGSILPAGETFDATSTRIDQEITVLGLDGPWLPAVDRADEVTGVAVAYEPGTGTLLHPDGLAPDLRYHVVSSHSEHKPSELVSAGMPSSAEFDRYVRLPNGLPGEIRDLAKEATEGATTGYDRALKLENYLSTQYKFAPAAPSGHGYLNLKFYLDTPEADGGGKGTSEQFATAFAVMARSLGLPARVVVGFHAGSTQNSSEYLIRTGDAFAWPEVYFAGQGWVAFDPTPTDGKNSTAPDEKTAQAEAAQAEKEERLQALEDAKDEPPANAPVEPAAPKAEVPEGPQWPLIVLGGAGGVVVLALGSLIGLAFARRSLRHRRLCSGDPSMRIAGAWWELLDALALAGRPSAASLTAAEIAGAAASADVKNGGLPPVDELAAAVNMVVFAPGLADATAAENAEASLNRYVRALRGQQPILRRLWWPFDPRPLRWKSARRRLSAAPLPQERVSTG